MKRIALIGYGYWGPNLLRNLVDTGECIVKYCCDLDAERLRAAKRRYPGVETTGDIKKLEKDKELNAVVIATPARTHYGLTKRFLELGKDVLVEKPLSLTFEQAQDLAKLAKKKKRVLMVDHTFLFHPAVIKIKQLLEAGEIGEILYIDAVRVNLGLIQKETDVIYDLAVHDFSIVSFLLGSFPKEVVAHTESFYGRTGEVAYVLAKYPKNILVNVHVSWLSPAKIRKMVIVGTKKMVVYDDTEPAEAVKVFDKGIEMQKIIRDIREIKVAYRAGDIWTPKIEVVEPLCNMTKAFIQSLQTREVEKSGADFGVSIVKTLESAAKSAAVRRKIILNS